MENKEFAFKGTVMNGFLARSTAATAIMAAGSWAAVWCCSL